MDLAAGPDQKFSGESSAPAAARVSPGVSDLKWEKFQDPFEHAFTIEVPQGWTVKGGLFRVGYSDYRPMLDLQSPDGKAPDPVGRCGHPVVHTSEPVPHERGRD